MNDMDDKNLFDGVGVVIDDHVLGNNEHDDKIIQLVDFLENKKHLPLVKYVQLPDDIDISALLAINFLLLDWDLSGLDDDFGIPISTPALKENAIIDNIKFLKKITETVVVPIFIFSNDSVDEIKNRLIEENILEDDNAAVFPIFIKSKSDLFDENGQCIMFDLINTWLNNIPSIYVTQKWKNTYLEAINGMALDMREASPFWPNLLWSCYTSDGVNPSEEISSLINQNALSRILPVEFDQNILSGRKACDEHILKSLLERQCFMRNEYLGGLSSTGDIYKWQQKYFLNIRPSCDCVGRDGNNKIYLLKGDKVKDKEIQNGLFNDKYGNFNEQSNFVIVGPIDGFFFRFKFKDIVIEDFEKKKDKRIGRLLPPFITRVTQKYGLYIHRQGLPRLPKEVISAVAPIDDDNKDEFGEETIDALQEEIKDSKSKLQQLSKENKELKAKMKRMANSQNCYRLYNCKVTISPSLKRRKGKR